MTREYQTVQNTLYHLEGNRDIGVAGEDAKLTVVGPVRQTDTRIYFGPLVLEPAPGGTIGLERLDFPLRGDGWFDFDNLWPFVAGAGVIGGANHLDSEDLEHADEPVSRRDVLKMGAAIGGVAAVGGAARAETTPVLDVAELDLFQNDGGLKVSIADVVTDVLSITEEMFLTVDGARLDEFHADNGSAVIPPNTRGTVSLHSEDHKSRMAWAQALFADFEHKHEFDLPKAASEYEAGETVVLSSSAVVVDPMRDHGGDDATMAISGTSIPHRDESDEPVGQYFVTSNSELAYAPGEDAPSATTVTVRINVGRTAEAYDDTTRTTQV